MKSLIQWVLTLEIDVWKFGTPTPKVWVHFGMCGFIPSHTPLHSRECTCDSRVAFLAHTFPCMYLSREPKVKVMTHDDTHANSSLSLNFHPSPHPSHYKWFESKCQCVCLGKETYQWCIEVWNFHCVMENWNMNVKLWDHRNHKLKVWLHFKSARNM